MSDLHRRVEDLSETKRRLLAERLGLFRAEEPAGDGDLELIAYVAGERRPIEGGELRAHLEARLPAALVPRQLIALDSLPRTPNGKIDRAALPAPSVRSVKIGGSVHAEHRAPSDELEASLLAMWREVLGREDLGVHDDFFENGGHSLLAMKLFSMIEREFDTVLPLAAIFRHPSVAKIAAVLRPRADAQGSPSIVQIQEGKRGRAPLFCVHCGAGSVFHYRALAQHLGPEFPVFGVHPVGVDGRTRYHTTVAEMSAHYANEILATWPAGPYLLCGYSYGGTVAFDIAQRLRREDREVALVGLFDTGVYWSVPVSARVSTHARRLADLGLLARGRYIARSILGNLRTFVRDTWRATKRFANLAPARLYVAMGRPLPVKLQTFYLRDLAGRAMLSYVPEPYDGELTLFRQEARSWEFRDRPDLGWGEIVPPERLRIVDLPGTHGDMLKEPDVRELAERLRGLLR